MPVNSQARPRLRSIYRGEDQQQTVRDWCTSQLDRWTLPHQRSQVHTCAGPTHVVSVGSGASTVVVVPGTNDNAALLESFAAALAGSFTAILLDLPGQPGLSVGHRPNRDRLGWYGRWLADVLAQTVPDGAVVLGHSLGGAITLACDSPHITARALIAPAGLVRLKIPRSVIHATVPWILRPTPARSAALLHQMFAPGHTPPPRLVDWYTIVAQNCRTSLAPRVLPDAIVAQRATTESLVVTGDHDKFLPPDTLADPARRRLGVELTVIPDAGHHVIDEHPQTIANLLKTLTTTNPDHP
jgi:pimeloyl-ACP methyl ester carboxylesterase